MMLDRRDGESELEHHRRLLFGKLVDRSIDVDYKMLSPYLYGKQYAEDVARRMAYGSLRTLKLLDDAGIAEASDSDVVEEIERQQFELRKERQRFFDQRREYNKLASRDGRVEHLFDVLARSAENLTNTVGNVFEGRTCSMSYSGTEDVGLDKTEAVLVFSDWHYGMTCFNSFNEYNTEVCRDRVINVVEQAIKRITLHNVRKLHLVVLGDLIHGAIHASARVASEELVCDQLMQASELLAQAIQKLREYVPEVAVYITYGNHARTVQNKNDNIHRDNMERIVPWWLKQRFMHDEDVEVVEDDGTEFLFVDACGHEICAAHGDLDDLKRSSHILPLLFQKQMGRDVEYLIFGDKHHRESVDSIGITSIICGSLCGTDDYANSKRLYSKPEQLMLIVNESDGVDAEYHLKCDAPYKE